MPDLRNFRLNSDYPMDKIVLLWSGSMVPPTYTASFAHNFGEPVLCFGIWSTDPNFSSPHSLTGIQSDVYGGSVAVWSDSSNIYVQNGVFDPTTYDSPTVYFRVYAILQSDSIVTTNPTSTSAATYILNSDYNYLPLVASFTTTFNAPYNHGLGYKPLVLTWVDYEGNSQYVQPEDSSVLLGGYNEYGVLVDENTVQYYGSSVMVTEYPNAKIYMRIYG